MKSIVTYIVAVMAILCCLLAYACSHAEEFYPELSIWVGGENLSSSSLIFDEAGGRESIEIKSNTEWKVECSADWLELSPRSGRGRQRVDIAVDPSDKSRSCVVTVSLSDVAQMRHSFDVIQLVADKPQQPDEPQNPADPDDPDDPSEPSEPDNPDEPTNPDTPENPSDPDNPDDPSDPENPDEPENPDGPENPENPEEPAEPEQPEQPEEPAPVAITIPELIALMSDDGQPKVIDAERDRLLTAVVVNDLEGGNFPASHLILATEGSASQGNGIVLYGRIVKPEALGVTCGDKVEVLLKAGISVAIKNNSLMYEVTGDAAKQWAEIRLVARNMPITVADIAPSQLAAFQGMTVRLRGVTPLSEGVWYESTRKGNIEFTSSSGEKFTVQVLESAKFSSRQYHSVQGDICGVVAIDGHKVVLRPRNEADLKAFDGPAPEAPEEPEQPDNPDNPTDSDDTTDSDNSEGEGGSDDEGNANEGGNSDGEGDADDEGDTDGEGDSNGSDDSDEKEEPTQPEEPTEPEQPSEPEQPASGYFEVNSLAQLAEGEYYIGGYRDGELYLATGELTQQNHCVTSKYIFQQGNLSTNGSKAATVALERAADNAYYIRFPKGYLVAVGARAGALRFSDKPDKYWFFSSHPEKGFVLRQSGNIDVQIIISESAPEALLRSVAGDEEGLGVVLFRHNK